MLKLCRVTARFALLDSSHPSSFPAPQAVRQVPGVRYRCAIIVAVGLAAAVFLEGGQARAQPAPAQRIAGGAFATSLEAFVAEASHRFGVPAAWIRAVIHVESFGEAHAVSPRGAMGLMQIMPETWADLRQRYHLGGDPYDAHDNIAAGAAYLRELHDRYGFPGFLAAYNAGPARWEAHLATGQSLPAETRAYLARLVPIVAVDAVDDALLLGSVVRSWTEAPLFAGRPTGTSSDAQLAAAQQSPRSTDDRLAGDWTGLAPQSDGLFVALSSGERAR